MKIKELLERKIGEKKSKIGSSLAAAAHPDNATEWGHGRASVYIG